MRVHDGAQLRVCVRVKDTAWRVSFLCDEGLGWTTTLRLKEASVDESKETSERKLEGCYVRN